MPTKLLTFHRILPACGQGDREAWRAFLSNYTPIVLQLRSLYFPGLPEERQMEAWGETLRALAANDFEKLKSFGASSEREFLVDLRALLFENGSLGLDPARALVAVPAPTGDSMSALLKTLPLAQQEVAFLKLAGYSDSTLEALLRIPHSLTEKVVERLRPDYGPILGRTEDACPWSGAWQALLREVWARKKEDCADRRIFLHILDGQTTWYEKGPADEKIMSCLHCLEGWVALREVNYWRNVCPPLPENRIEPLLEGLPLSSEPARKKALFGRLFG